MLICVKLLSEVSNFSGGGGEEITHTPKNTYVGRNTEKNVPKILAQRIHVLSHLNVLHTNINIL